MASEYDRNQPAPENVEQEPASTVSEHQTQHKQNPNKSKPPARRKAASTFYPGAHGRLLPLVAGDGKGNADEGLKNLYTSLADRFDSDDVVNALLIELAVTDYWRQSKAVQYELNNLRSDGWGFHPKGELPPLTRYLTTSRRNLDKSLQMLLQMEKQAAEAEASEPETEEAGTRAVAGDASSPSQPETTPAKTEEAVLPAASATFANEAAASEPPATVVQGGEAEPNQKASEPEELPSTASPVPPTDEAGTKPADELPKAA